MERYLTKESISGFLEEEIEKGEVDIEEHVQITDLKETTQDFLDYMLFGWSKALAQRGISASRTIDKLSHWLWLLGREDLAKLVTKEKLYNPYGVPALIELAKKIEIEVPKELKDFANSY